MPVIEKDSASPIALFSSPPPLFLFLVCPQFFSASPYEKYLGIGPLFLDPLFVGSFEDPSILAHRVPKS